MRKHRLIIFTACLLIMQLNQSSLPAFAITEMQKGTSLYNKQDYKNALSHFILAVRNNPNDSNALYYEALTFHQLKELDLAKGAYTALLKRFPNTDAAKRAQQALTYLDPTAYRAMQQQQSRASGNQGASVETQQVQSSSDNSILPEQARIPYVRDGENLVVSTYVNARPIDMYFDSGAEVTVVFKSQLEGMGIKAPTGHHVGMSYGVGSGGGQKTWIMNIDLKVGQIERRNFPLHVQEDAPTSTPRHPLLGENFFKDYSLSMEPAPDQQSGTILFRKKSTASNGIATSDSSVIPFTNWGKEIIVSVEVNGKMVPMIFDTGASICSFPLATFKRLGFTVPEDAQEGQSAGVSGSSICWNFTLPRMRLGPIIKTDVPVSVVQDSSISYPLLGNSFLGDLRMDIDGSAHLMRLRR